MTVQDLPSGKLILLYMLSKVSGMPAADLQAWAIESLYLDYFSFAQAKEELKRDHLMAEAVRKGESRKDASGRFIELCDITPEGEVVLNRLVSTIPMTAQAYLTQTAVRWGQNIRAQANVKASYDPDANGAYVVRLSLYDGTNRNCEILLPAPDEDTAQKMCRRWKESTAGIYKNLLLSLCEDEHES
jgi:Domain of unknown function (DUF4364)